MDKTTLMTVDGVTLRVRVQGETSPALLMMNGWGVNLESFDALAQELGRGRQLIRFDPPGIGGTSCPARPHRLSRTARQVAAVLDNLEVEDVDVLGYSWGGALAQAFTLAYPERVNRLVLMATAPGVLMVPAWPTIAPAFMDRRWLTNLVRPSHYFGRAFLTDVGPRLFGGRLRHDAMAFMPAMRRIHPVSLRTMLWQALGGATFTSVHRLQTLRQPTLVMAGTDDPVINPLNARIMRTLIPNATLHWIEGGGHLFPVLQSERCAGPVKNFLGTHPTLVPFRKNRGQQDAS